MTEVPDKPFLDQEGPPAVHGETRHLYHLPRTCWTRRKTGEPMEMYQVTGIVLHKISGRYVFPDKPFDPQLIDEQILIPNRLSYTIMIYRDGTAVRRVPEPYQSFHAGFSRYDGEEYCNRFMIGICLVSKGYSDQQSRAFEPVQIDKLADITTWLMGRHDFPAERITSHEHVRTRWNEAHPNEKAQSRRGDPGTFPWQLFRERLVDLIEQRSPQL